MVRAVVSSLPIPARPVRWLLFGTIILYLSGVYAPADFQLRVARMRSWRLDLIDASHLNSPAAGDGAVNGTSPTGTTAERKSKLPSQCAHLDAYVGVSYSLAFNAQWRIAHRSGAGSGGSRFVNPFGPLSGEIFSELLRLECPYHRFAFSNGANDRAHRHTHGAAASESDGRVTVDWTDYQLLVSTPDANQSVEPYLSPFRVSGLLAESDSELVVLLVLAPSFFSHYRDASSWPIHNACKLKLSTSPNSKYQFTDRSGQPLQTHAHTPLVHDRTPQELPPKSIAARTEATVVVDLMPAVRLQMLRVPDHLRHVMYPKAGLASAPNQPAAAASGATPVTASSAAYELSDPQFTSLLESSVWTFPHRDKDGRIKTNTVTAQSSSAGEVRAAVERSVFGMEVTKLDKAMELGFSIGRKYFAIPDGEDDIFLEEDVLLQLNDFLHTDEAVGTATGWILFAIIEGLFPKAIEKGEEILGETLEKYLIPLEEDLLGGSPVGPESFIEVDTKITPSRMHEQLTQLDAKLNAKPAAAATINTAAPAPVVLLDVTPPPVLSSKHEQLLASARASPAGDGDVDLASVLLELSSHASASLLAPKGESKKTGGPGGFGGSKSGGRSAIANGPGTLAIAISKDIIKSAPDFMAKVSEVMSGMLTVNLHDSVIQAVRDRISEHVSRATIDALNSALPVTLTETVPAAIKRILPSYLMHALEHTLTNTLTRSITHTVSATLAHTLAISPQREAVCFYCEHYQLLLAECRSCLAQKRSQYISHYYRHHFASYFSDYYTDYYTVGLGKKDGEDDASITRPS